MGRMHHGWLVAGAEGIGKATLAYRLARYVLASPNERQPGTLDIAPENRTARQVLALSHPGLLVLRRAYDTKTKRFPAAIDHLLSDESLLLVFTASKGLQPESVAPARTALARSLGAETYHD